MKKIAIIGGGISGLYFANLLNNEKDFFNNWKNYAGKDSQNNVEIINAI